MGGSASSDIFCPGFAELDFSCADGASPCDAFVLMFPLRDCYCSPLPRPGVPLLGSFCWCFRDMESVSLLLGDLDHLVDVLEVLFSFWQPTLDLLCFF